MDKIRRFFKEWAELENVRTGRDDVLRAIKKSKIRKDENVNLLGLRGGDDE